MNFIKLRIMFWKYLIWGLLNIVGGLIPLGVGIWIFKISSSEVFHSLLAFVFTFFLVLLYPCFSYVKSKSVTTFYEVIFWFTVLLVAVMLCLYTGFFYNKIYFSDLLAKAPKTSSTSAYLLLILLSGVLCWPSISSEADEEYEKNIMDGSTRTKNKVRDMKTTLEGDA